MFTHVLSTAAFLIAILEIGSFPYSINIIPPLVREVHTPIGCVAAVVVAPNLPPYNVFPPGTGIALSRANVDTRIILSGFSGASQFDAVDVPYVTADAPRLNPTSITLVRHIIFKDVPISRVWFIDGIGAFLQLIFLAVGYPLARGASTSKIRYLFAILCLSLSLSYPIAAAVFSPVFRFAVACIVSIFLAAGTFAVLWLFVRIAHRDLRGWFESIVLLCGAVATVAALVGDLGGKIGSVITGCQFLFTDTFGPIGVIASTIVYLLAIVVLIVFAASAGVRRRWLALTLLGLLLFVNIYGSLQAVITIATLLKIPTANLALLSVPVGLVSYVLKPSVIAIVFFVLLVHRILRVTWNDARSVLLEDLKRFMWALGFSALVYLVVEFGQGHGFWQPVLITFALFGAAVESEGAWYKERLLKARTRR